MAIPAIMEMRIQVVSPSFFAFVSVLMVNSRPGDGSNCSRKIKYKPGSINRPDGEANDEKNPCKETDFGLILALKDRVMCEERLKRLRGLFIV